MHTVTTPARKRTDRSMRAAGALGSGHGRETDGGASTGAAVTERPSFALERFAWAGPDRLELVGTFSAVPYDPAGEVWLVVRGATGAHRLPVVAVNAEGAASDRRWTATFAWQEAPVAFDTAQLRFESGIRVDLPQPGTKRLLRRTILEVQYPDGADDRPTAAPGTARASDGAAPAPPVPSNGDRP